ncbi:MAG: ATP-binding protein [Pseudomonadota bacterium]
MNRFLPRTLLGRNVLLLTLAIAMTASLSLAAIFVFLINDQLNRASSIAADLINTVSAAASVVDEQQRERLVNEAIANENIQILPGNERPGSRQVRANTFQTIYIERFKERLRYQDELDWFVDEDGYLWLRLFLGMRYYWVAVRLETTLTPMNWLLGYLALTVVTVSILSIWGGRTIARPLAQLRAATDELDLDSDIKLPRTDAPAEVAALTNSFRRMANRLKRAESIRSETLAAFSHDLRTPLARLRLAVEMLDGDDELKASANRQVHDIDAMIGQFMDYARGSLGEDPEEFDIAFTVADIAAQYQIAYDGPESLDFLGHHNAVRRAMINLIENAGKYGAAPISLNLTYDGSDVIVEVHDRGHGFDPEKAREMLQSFRRGSEATSVSGSGLGLAIVDQAARAHRGSITFERRVPSGFVARLNLQSLADENQPHS